MLFLLTTLILSNAVKTGVEMCSTAAQECNPTEAMDDLIENHELFQNKYLKRFSLMEYENEAEAIKNFATEHYVYSRNFQVYLQNVLQKVNDTESIKLISGNLHEERGNYEEDDLELLGQNGVKPEWFNKISHPILMKRFVTASKADTEFNGGVAREFTDLMIKTTADGDACVGLAIMAFAIESTVSRLYQFIWDGLKHSSMEPADYAFFPLHVLIDDGHADALKVAWMTEYEQNPQQCFDSSYHAVKTILDARARWYDHMDAQLTWKGIKQGANWVLAKENPTQAMDNLVETHPLFDNKYLKRFSKMQYEDEEKTITNFATEHYVYSRNFQVYLENVLQKVDDKESMGLIAGNLHEERGNYEEEDLELLGKNGVDPEWFNGISHPILMRRFVTESKADTEFNGGFAREFTDLMIKTTKEGDACVGLAIMAFAIESTVSTLYTFIWDGLKLSSMEPSAYAFFPLHVLIDDGHADALKVAWLKQYELNPKQCFENSYNAVKTILDARGEWYDHMDSQLKWAGDSADGSNWLMAKSDPAQAISDFVDNHHLFGNKYLKRFSLMEYEDEAMAIKNFATEHYVYSRNFQVYLENVLSKVSDKESMELIAGNLHEERGNYEEEDLELLGKNGVDPEWFNGISHPFLMKRFVTASKADTEFNGGVAREFTDLMIQTIKDGDACVGLAIMAFAIEQTVSTLYTFIWDGLKRSSMEPSKFVFFPLHVLIDDGHADALKVAWMKQYDLNPKQCYENSYNAVKTILDARAQWYDHMDSQLKWVGATKESEIKLAKKRTMEMLDPGYSQHQKLALTARILAWQGQGHTLSGQITCRDTLRDGKLGVWVPKYGLGVEELIPSDFILVDEDLKPVDPNETSFPNYATRFHIHVYRKRPDIKCIVHSHPLHVSALAMTGRNLEPEHMDFMAFYEEVQFLEEWPGVPFGDLEGELISGLLGEKHWSGLLANHGLIVGGRSIEEACYRAYFFERAAEAQLMAMGATGGKLKPVKKSLGNQARDWRISEGPVQAHFRFWSRMVFRNDPTAKREILGRGF